MKSTVYQEIQNRDAPTLRRLSPPIQRAAYSDRIAWQMAILAELAYIEFERAPLQILSELAEELAKASGVHEIESKLKKLENIFSKGSRSRTASLKAILKVAGFELVDTFYNRDLDPLKNTEGFVAKTDGTHHSRAFAVLSIRGTTSYQDWMYNADAGLEEINGGVKVHKGFHRAYLDASEQIDSALANVGDDRPLFICGHSLGGAVAVIATWYKARDSLGACYTFGAPRVGDHRFNDSFHTPIYRIVNAFDPVPMLPPSEHIISVLKFVLRIFENIALASIFRPLRQYLTKVQHYRHAGDLRHMTAGEMDADGSYPTVKYLKSIGLIERTKRAWELLLRKCFKRPDRYHDMSTYRRKLRARAIERAPQDQKQVLDLN